MAEVHPSAIVEPGATLGREVRIWHWVHVRAGAVIGDGTSIGQGCYVGAVVIGRGCRIQNHVSLYDGLTIEDEVFLGPSCVFTNVKHPRAFVSRKHAYAPTVIGRGASIGANATIVCGVTIGAYALVGAGAVVTRDVAPYALVVGAPARRAGWACRCGETLPAAPTLCAHCGARYAVTAAGLAPA
ncbi:MAG TPA: acyltransferase [Kofleriaceae bacterium]|nr:acyltransferase [Kofleriaceae bacterium]